MKEHTGIEETMIFFKEHNSLSNVTGSNSVRFSEREREYHDLYVNFYQISLLIISWCQAFGICCLSILTQIQ